MACQQIKDKARRLAAHLLQAPVDEVVYDAGKMYRSSKPEQVQTFKDIAMAAWLAWDLPKGMEPCLDVTTYFDPKEFNFPFGTHVALVEIDEQTGKVDLVRYVAVNDLGNVGNPAVVNGQMHGNIALGVGQALFEGAVYDRDGLLLTGDLTNYAIPRPPTGRASARSHRQPSPTTRSAPRGRETSPIPPCPPRSSTPFVTPCRISG